MTGKITTNAAIEPAAGVTIDGDGNELKFATATGDGASSAEGLYISNDGITIKNLVIDAPEHADNGIEIYSSATLVDVIVKGSKKAGIYVNNNGTGTITVNFTNVKTSGNLYAGVGLVAQQAGSKIIANFISGNTFSESPVGVYSEQGKSSSDFSSYKGTVEVTGLTEYAHPSKPTFQKAYK